MVLGIKKTQAQKKKKKKNSKKISEQILGKYLHSQQVLLYKADKSTHKGFLQHLNRSVFLIKL